MDISVHTSPRLTTITLDGELDSETAPLAEQRLLPLIGDDCKLLLDMGQVSFMSSAGLRMLFALRRQLPPDGRLVLAQLSEQIKDTMSVTGFIEYFTVAETLPEATALLN